MANGKCKTLRDGETSVFFFARHFDFVNCETETSKREDVEVYKNKQIGTSTETSLPLQKNETPRRFHEKIENARPVKSD